MVLALTVDGISLLVVAFVAPYALGAVGSTA